MRRLRFGVIGAGAVASTHLMAMRSVPEAEVVAVADVSVERARALAERYCVPKAYESAEELLQGCDVDALDVLTPHHLHTAIVRVAAKAGKHVLVEKAIADSVGAAKEMIQICRAHGVTLGGILQNRFTDAARTVKQMVQDKALGRVFLACASVLVQRSREYYNTAPWRGERPGGGVLMINAIHVLDLLQWLIGVPTRVVAQTASAIHGVEAEDVAAGMFEWENGTLALFRVTTAATAEIPPELEICGDRGMAAIFESLGDAALWCSTCARVRSLAERWSEYISHYHEQQPIVPAQPLPQAHAANIADFVAAVRDKRSPLVDGVEACKSLLLIDAIRRSAAAGGWVEVANSGASADSNHNAVEEGSNAAGSYS